MALFMYSSHGFESHPTYNGRELMPQIPLLTFKCLRGVVSEIVIEH